MEKKEGNDRARQFNPGSFMYSNKVILQQGNQTGFKHLAHIDERESLRTGSNYRDFPSWDLAEEDFAVVPMCLLFLQYELDSRSEDLCSSLKLLCYICSQKSSSTLNV